MSVNTRMEPMAVEIVSVGTLNACLVEMREVFKHAILNNAAGLYVSTIIRPETQSQAGKTGS